MKGAIKSPMAIILTNQAVLNYRNGSTAETALSNITSTVLNGSLSITKSVMSDCYKASQILTYIINVRNNGSSTASNVIINDDLGTFNVADSRITPLTYIGNERLYINGDPDSGITAAESESGVIFEISEIPPKGAAQLIYLAQVNGYACCTLGSTITNTATAEDGCNCPCAESSNASAEISVCEYTDLRIVKSVCPNPATCEDRFTYTFNLYNYGNIPATDVVLTDTFEPSLKDLEIRANGDIIPPENYDYINGTVTFPSEDSDYFITVPPAECIRNPTTSAVESNPGMVQITISGTL